MMQFPALWFCSPASPARPAVLGFSSGSSSALFRPHPLTALLDQRSWLQPQAPLRTRPSPPTPSPQAAANGPEHPRLHCNPAPPSDDPGLMDAASSTGAVRYINLLEADDQAKPAKPASETPKPVLVSVPVDRWYSIGRYTQPSGHLALRHPDRNLRAPPGFAPPQTRAESNQRMREILGAIDARLQSSAT
ncbi:hypothetical protein G7Z17_g4947 [Cylindrodendrum hubeiense]|uniref:Uncharacterized protein n=1 Tax=Cylindrodendrum hubeiense TaxID=595255 RepID=A0A9P5HD13_9HYPO|nr:hypothetical protein G7Z17_g4947 [Cylindrodendrum hubeiense]